MKIRNTLLYVVPSSLGSDIQTLPIVHLNHSLTCPPAPRFATQLPAPNTGIFLDGYLYTYLLFNPFTLLVYSPSLLSFSVQFPPPVLGIEEHKCIQIAHKGLQVSGFDLINKMEVEKSFTVLFIALISSCSSKFYVLMLSRRSANC